ncbi:MAG: adenylyl-sulfate kinase [Acidimicrobiales bacterium]|jgi:bifunctional enzyme CysN/CysC
MVELPDTPTTPGGTVWLTGLPSAGKTTIAQALGKLVLAERARRAYLLDGDDLREGLNADLGFEEEDRAENVRRLGEVAILLARLGHLAVVSAISPYAASRKAVRARHDDLGLRFIEVYVSTPLEVCEARDPKGLYAKARRGELASFTGISAPYEAPESPELSLANEGSPEEAAFEVFVAMSAAGLLG